MSTKHDDFNLSNSMPEVKVAGEKPLNWFDVAAIGSGEMITNIIYFWVILAAVIYGVKWSLIGFVGGLVVVTAAWWLYREMITAVPEPGMLQSYGREAGLFSLGTSYFLLYVPVYASFNWLELQVVSGFLSGYTPSFPSWLWPIIIVVPIAMINFLGVQITGKLQAMLIMVILLADLIIGGAIWMSFDAEVWKANWKSPGPVTWLTFFAATGMWLTFMAGILEIQQVVQDDWKDFAKSRDIGLIFGAFQLAVTLGILGFGVLGLLPIAELAAMPIPHVGAIGQYFGHGALFTAILIFALAATYTTFTVYFMAMSRILALYSMQGALPRILSSYSKRAVPWFAILVCLVLTLIGAYWTDITFIGHMLSMWAATIYIVVAIFYLRMKRNKGLEKPYKARFGVAVAIFLLIYAGLISYALIVQDIKSAIVWFIVVAVIILYDKYIVPNTARGRHYRSEVLRERKNASRLG
jgi:amino acid transporter